MEEGTANIAEIQKEGVIDLQQRVINAVFKSDWAVAVGIVSIIAIMIIKGVTISYTLIISLVFLLALTALYYLYFDQQKKLLELEKQKKDEERKAIELKKQGKNEASKQVDNDKVEVEKLLSDSKDQILVEISAIENDWPVHTQSTNKLKDELNKLYNEIDYLSLKILSEASNHKQLIYTCNSGEWNHVLSFRKIQEDALKQCETKKSEISVLKKKFKLTDSAVLAETTRKTAEEMGYLLTVKDNGLKLYKLPLQLTGTHKKIRRFELGANPGKDHRYSKKSIL